MKVTHQLRDNKVEREVHPSIPIGFFISNKKGGMLFFDANRDQTQYYAKLGSRLVKVVHDISHDSRPVSIKNRFHSLDIHREGFDHTLFVPYYMDGLVMKSDKEQPIDLVLEPGDVSRKDKKNHNIYEKHGRVVIQSSNADSTGVVFTAIQGQNLRYDHDLKQGNARFTLQVLSPKITISVADNEDEAIANANHLFVNEDQISKLQDNYLSSATSGSDAEAQAAYACVLNGTDHVFMSGPESIEPHPYFTQVTAPHTAIATHALLVEGEFRIAKKALMRELDAQYSSLGLGKSRFEDAAWPLLLYGRMLNRLCNQNKLYTYFTKEELASTAAKIINIISLLKQRYCKEGPEPEAEKGSGIEAYALMLSVYNLEYALTKSEEALSSEHALREKTRELVEQSLSEMNEGGATRHGLTSVFLTAYIYPRLFAHDEWKAWFDSILEKIHYNFKSLRSKIQGPEESIMGVELFGLASLAALVLNRLDAEHYENVINQTIRTAVSDVLYKGMIGRPTSAYDHTFDIENQALFENKHLLNNALFLEMLRECA